MDKIESIVTTVLAAIMIAFFAFLLGKKKEDIEVALNYQKYYNNFIDALKNEMVDLHKIVKEQKEIILEQKEIIESQKKNIEGWTNNCTRLEILLNEERKKMKS